MGKRGRPRKDVHLSGIDPRPSDQQQVVASVTRPDLVTMSRSPLNNILNTEESVHQINTFLQSVQMLLEAASHIERIETENERRYTLTMTPARINVNAIVHHCRDGAMGERLCK